MKRSEIPRDSGAVVGCYSVHLYCRHPNHFNEWCAGVAGVCDLPMEFIAETRAECLREATRHGWWIGREDNGNSRAVLCPYHAREVSK